MTINLKLGTRASKLALAQTDIVISALSKLGMEASAQTFSTKGDREQEVPLQALGDKGIFTAELEAALRGGSVQAAIHSAKDMTALDDPDLPIVAALKRDLKSDVLISEKGCLEELEEGAVIGTSSLRRSSQLREARPDLQVVPIRGNLQTRIAKWQNGVVDALILAEAGLNRMQLLSNLPTHKLPWFHAPSQGIIAVQARVTGPHWESINHYSTFEELMIERALVRGLGASCRQPVACLLEKNFFQATAWGENGVRADGNIRLDHLILSEKIDAAEKLGHKLLTSLPDGLEQV